MKKSILRNLVVVALLLGLLFAAMPTQQAQAADLTITSLTEFEAFRDAVNAGDNFAGSTVTLATDIDLTGVAWVPIGTSSKTFAGIFDGGNYTISNVTVDTPTVDQVGLFGSVSGTVKNLNLNTVSIAGNQFVGGLIGYGYPSAKVINVHVTSVTVNSTHWAGGLVGYLYGQALDCSVTNPTVTTKFNTIKNDDGDKAGGLVGFLGENSVVQNCVVTNVNITGVRDVGGLIGNVTSGTRLWNNTVNGGTVTALQDPVYSDPKPYAGGMVGRGSGTNNIIYVPIANNVTVTSYDPAYAGPIYGGPASNFTLQNIELVSGTTKTYYATITDALAAAANGDVINLGTATYTENIVIGKSITLNGSGANSAFGTSPATVQGTITINSSDVTINDLKVVPGTVNGNGAGIHVYAGNVALNRNLIDGLNGDGNGTVKGIHVYSASGIANITLDHNLVKNINNTGRGSSGIMIQGIVDTVTISNNTVENIHSEGWAYGIEVTPTSNPANAIPQNVSITGNTITNITATTYPGVGLSIDQVNDNYTADASQVVVLNNKFLDSPVVNKDKNHTLNATHNYWGSADGPSGEDLYGKIKFFPFWIDPEMTQLSQVPETTLAMDPVTLEACEIGLGDYIVSVNVGPVYDLSAYQIKVSFDPAKLEVLDLINGDVLIGNAAEIKILGNDTGVLDYSRALYGNPDGWNLIDDPDGGTLMKIKVKTKAAGTSVMELLNTSILSRTDNAQHHPYDITNAKTTVTTSLYAVRNGAKSYCDLQTAVDEAIPGDTLTVLRDFTVAAPVQVAKEITFNTAGYTVTRTGASNGYDSLFNVWTGGELTITGTGTVNSTNTAETLGAAVAVYGGTLNLQGATLSGGYASVAVFADYETPATPGTFNMSSGMTTDGVFIFENGSTFNLTGGTVKTTKNQFAIAGNGDSWAAGTIINISGDAKVISEQAVAIYHPQDGTLTISGDAEISGPSAIQMKSGDLTVTGGTITATGSFIATPDPTDDGAQNTGDAIFAFSKEGYADFLNVEISGGTITSANGYAVREYVVPGETSRTQNVTISGGQLSGGPDAVFFSSDTDEVLDLTGGAYNTNPAAFVFYPLETYSYVDGAKTWYGIRDMWPVINLRDDSLYPTLQDAVDFALPGDTLQARLDFETTAPVVVEETITFDTNGKTITRTKASENYDNLFTVQNNGNLTITGGGTITTTSTNGEMGAAVKVTKGILNLGFNGNGATLSGDYTSVVIYGNIAGTTPISSTFNMTSGTTSDGIYVFGYGAELNVSGGTVTRSDTRAAISGNGSSAAAGTVINISGDANIIGASDDIAIYHPQDGVLNISGGTITAGSAIQMKSGDLNISGGTITANGPYVDPSTNPSGGNPTGDAILFLSQTGGYTGDMSINITGGTITSANGYAVQEYVLSVPSKFVNATIEGGQLSGGAGAVKFATDTDDVLDLIGGAYNTNPSEFVFIPKYVYFDDPWYRIGDMVGAVTGTVSMQGRTTRAGVPVKMTGGSVVIPTVTSTDDPGANLSFASLVPNTTYTITTNQPRYLNITSDLLKTKLITDGTETLATFRLFGGNAIWTDNKIDLLDYGLVTGAYGSTEETDADVNFDGVVNIFDLALVAGNYGLTSQTAYANWTP